MVKEIPVVYLQTAACSGCAVSMLNTASPTIKNVLIDQIAPGVHINLRFHPVVMASSGEMAIQVMEDTAKQKKDGYVLVVDGAVPTGANGVYGAVGERNGKPVTMLQRVTELASSALAVIAMGTCATAGGIQALRNFRDVGELATAVYAHPEYLHYLETSKPISEYVKVVGKFSHFKEDEIKVFQQAVNERYAMIKSLCDLSASREPHGN